MNMVTAPSGAAMEKLTLDLPLVVATGRDGAASQKPKTAKQSHALFSEGQQDGHFLPLV